MDNPVFQVLASPTVMDNVIYDAHSYPPSIARMIYFRLTAWLMAKNVPLYMSEFSSGFTHDTMLTEKQIFQYVKRFKKFGTCR
jgi:hypothetical protein